MKIKFEAFDKKIESWKFYFMNFTEVLIKL